MPINPELVTATDLHEAAGRLESQELIPRLVRRLQTRTLGVEGVTMRATEGIRLGGWDGKVTASAGSAYVPVGASVWEVGVGQNPKGKADEEYEKRCKDPLGVDPATSAFVFVTSRRWSGKEEWVKDKMKDGVWREIRVLDADDLHGFLELSPGVHTWISEELGRLPLGVVTLERWAEIWSTQTDPPLPLELLLAGRGESAAYLRALLERDAGVAGVRGGSRDEAMAFIATALLVPPLPPEDPGDEDTGAEGADGHEESAGTLTEGAGETAPNASEDTEDKRESSSETATTPEASEDGNGRDAGDGDERGETGEPA
ncbi:MAG: hypothetical protein M3R46_13480, partial [Actinomycetota bacterium]|nr:hypothetical protein [Actinomycetota bacterium]